MKAARKTDTLNWEGLMLGLMPASQLLERERRQAHLLGTHGGQTAHTRAHTCVGKTCARRAAGSSAGVSPERLRRFLFLCSLCLVHVYLFSKIIECCPLKAGMY